MLLVFQHVQITTIDSCHNSSTFMTKIQKTDLTKCCDECGALKHYCWEGKFSSHFGKQLGSFLKLFTYHYDLATQSMVLTLEK